MGRQTELAPFDAHHFIGSRVKGFLLGDQTRTKEAMYIRQYERDRKRMMQSLDPLTTAIEIFFAKNECNIRKLQQKGIGFRAEIDFIPDTPPPPQLGELISTLFPGEENESQIEKIVVFGRFKSSLHPSVRVSVRPENSGALYSRHLDENGLTVEETVIRRPFIDIDYNPDDNEWSYRVPQISEGRMLRLLSHERFDKDTPSVDPVRGNINPGIIWEIGDILLENPFDDRSTKPSPRIIVEPNDKTAWFTLSKKHSRE